MHRRRCLHCNYKNNYPLPPPPEKKLIYLDQLAVSNMAEQLDQMWRKERPSDAIARFWLKVFNRLYRLVKLQLVVCPYSLVHRRESAIVDGHAAVLRRRLHQHLAAGVRFRSQERVVTRQLKEALRASSMGVDPDWDRINSEEVVDGCLDCWDDPGVLTGHVDYWHEGIESFDATREKVGGTLDGLQQYWASEQSSFEDQFDQERQVFARQALYWYNKHSMVGSPPAWPARVVIGLLHVLKLMNVEWEERIRIITPFLESERAMSAPQNHLMALLYATLAKEAGDGRTKPFGGGMLNDMVFISTYLPYCDAMFVDKEWAHFLSNGKLGAAVRCYPTKIFSLRHKCEFLSYLKKIERGAGSHHIHLAASIYGKAWFEPSRSILEQGAEPS